MLNSFLADSSKDSGFSSKGKYLLLTITIAAALFRFVYQYDRAFEGDEIGTLIYIQKSIPYLLSHFETWLSINYFLVLEKIISSILGNGQFSLGLVPLIAGIFTIPATAFLAIRFTSARVALMSALLVAVNPYLIKYSGMTRSYLLLVLLSLVLVILFLNWMSNRTLRNGVAFSTCAFFLILFHPNGAYVLASVLTLAGMDMMVNFNKRHVFNVLKTLVLPLFISMLLIAVL